MSESLRQARQRLGWIEEQMRGVAREAQERTDRVIDTHLNPLREALDAAIEGEAPEPEPEPPTHPDPPDHPTDPDPPVEPDPPDEPVEPDPPGDVRPAFSDGFESGDTSHTEGGVSWGASTAGVSVSRADPRTGSWGLELRYDVREDGYGTAEQHFDLGRPRSRVWYQYGLKVPSNFVHRDNRPTNNKFFQLKSPSPSQKNLLTVEFERETDTTSGFRRFLSESTHADGSNNWPVSTPGARNIIGAGYHIAPGVYAKIGIHYRAASGPGRNDGRAEVWVNGVLVHSLDYAFWDNVHGGKIQGGYIMGWANSGYAERTSFFVDDVDVWFTDPGWAG